MSKHYARQMITTVVSSIIAGAFLLIGIMLLFVPDGFAVVETSTSSVKVASGTYETKKILVANLTYSSETVVEGMRCDESENEREVFQLSSFTCRFINLQYKFNNFDRGRQSRRMRLSTIQNGKVTHFDRILYFNIE